MKRTIAIFAGGLMLGLAVGAYAGPMKGHPNLEAAHKFLVQADEKITAAQKANEYDMEGHAQKAKDLITQALPELKQAAEAANTNKK
jgi:hypothetical protein